MSRTFRRSWARALLLSACLGLAAIQFTGCSSREQRAQNYYQNGMNYLAKKDYVKARIELRNAVQLKGDMVEAWRALAQIDEHNHNWKALAGSLRKVIELDPKDIATRVRLTKLFLFAGAFDLALKTANAAGELAPQNADIFALKAAILFRLKDINGATQAAQKTLEIDAGNVAAIAVLAVAKYSQGDATGALQLLDEVKAADKDDVSILSLKIAIFDHMGNTQQAEALLRKLIALHPKVPAFRTRLVRFYIAHKRQDDALHELRAAANADPADTNAELQLVGLLNILKGPGAARTELIARIKAGGRVFPYQIALATLDFAQGNDSDSKKLLQQLINNSSSRDDILTARITLAELYINKKNIAAAKPIISDILRTDSRNIAGLRLRALIRIDQGHFDDAIADVRTALNDQPQSPGLLATLALAYERSGSIELADKAYFDATKASGFAPAYGLNYVAFLNRRGLTEQAKNVLNDLANRNPNNLAVLSTLAQDKLVHRDWAAAHAVAEAISKLGGNNAVANEISGAAFSGQKRFDESLAAFQNAYKANPGAAQPMAALVAVYLHSKQIDKAEAFIQEVLKANPDNVEALVLKGTIQLAKNNLSLAEKDFKDAIRKQPTSIAGYGALAKLYVQEKKIEAALDIVRTGLRQQPKSGALRLTLGGLLEIKGDYEAAIAEYEAMLKDQPGSMVVANNLASLLSDHRTDKASLERAASLTVLLKDSQVPQFKDTIGWVNYKRGNYTAAASMLEGAVAELPNNALVHYHLGMTYLSTGQDAKAVDQFKKAKDLAPNNPDLKKKIDAALKGRSEKNKG
jgi:Tfp pilus assembly protein PilF